MAASRRRAAVAGIVAAVGLGVGVAPGNAQPTSAVPTEVGFADAAVSDLCTPTEPELAEVSGLAVVGGELHAVADGGESVRVAVLGADCAVTRWVTDPLDPYDVEDLAVDGAGTLWLADIGDNSGVRGSVALIGIDPATGGPASLRRLSYPDGAHDAEALLIERGGRPVVVTKSIGTSGVYVPQGDLAVTELAEPGPTMLQRVGTVRFGGTDTPGGPFPPLGSTMVTGGAVSADGTVAALRTYTDAYLYHAPDGDLVSALAREPVVVRLPNEPQGEAVAFTAEGDLVSVSETGANQPGAGALPPVRVVRGAVELARSASAPAPTAPDQPSTQAADESREVVLLVSVAVVAAVVIIAGGAFLRGRRRRQ